MLSKKERLHAPHCHEGIGAAARRETGQHATEAWCPLSLYPLLLLRFKSCPPVRVQRRCNRSGQQVRVLPALPVPDSWIDDSCYQGRKSLAICSTARVAGPVLWYVFDAVHALLFECELVGFNSGLLSHVWQSSYLMQKNKTRM